MESNTGHAPYVFLTFSNPRGDLAELDKEANAIANALELAKRGGLIAEVIPAPRILTRQALTGPFRDQAYRSRIAIFHYGGHGTPFQLLLEEGAPAGQHADIRGLAHLLSTQVGPSDLKLVFLNACRTDGGAEALLEVAGVHVVIATSQA